MDNNSYVNINLVMVVVFWCVVGDMSWFMTVFYFSWSMRVVSYWSWGMVYNWGSNMMYWGNNFSNNLWGYVVCNSWGMRVVMLLWSMRVMVLLWSVRVVRFLGNIDWDFDVSWFTVDNSVEASVFISGIFNDTFVTITVNEFITAFDGISFTGFLLALQWDDKFYE